MPAISNGSGFVGFGDYENANQGATDSTAKALEGAEPDWNSDLTQANSDVAGVNADYDAEKQADALAHGNQVVNKGITPTSGPITTSTTHTTETPQQGGGVGINEAHVTKTTQPVTDYQSWENANGGASAGANDPNNPYNVNKDSAFDPTQTTGYQTAVQDIGKAATDAQTASNLGSFGGAFAALQSKYGGPGSDFDANLLNGNGGLHSYADAASQGATAAGNLNGTLATDLKNDAGQTLSNSYAPPAAPGTPVGYSAPPLAYNGHNGSQVPGGWGVTTQPAAQPKRPVNVNKAYNWSA